MSLLFHKSIKIRNRYITLHEMPFPLKIGNKIGNYLRARKYDSTNALKYIL